MTDATTCEGRPEALRRLLRHCAGQGLELGPGHNPMPLPFAGTSVRYVDRWEPEASRELFPELGETAPFAEPDIVANLDEEGLRAIPDGTQDFVIASHVLEHVAEPIGMLAEVHRVLKPGGTVLVLLPDRRRTFDAGRQPTSLQHLLDEHARGVTTVDDAHVEEFLRGTGEDLDAVDPAEQAGLFELHRRRSIHVHCWAEEEWAVVVGHCIAQLGQEWELLEVLNNADVPGSIEFGVLLRRSTAGLGAAELRARYDAVLADFGPSARAGALSAPAPSTSVAVGAAPPAAAPSQVAELQLELALARQDADNWRALATERGAKLDALSSSPAGPLLRLAWSARRRARG